MLLCHCAVKWVCVQAFVTSRRARAQLSPLLGNWITRALSCSACSTLSLWFLAHEGAKCMDSCEPQDRNTHINLMKFQSEHCHYVFICAVYFMHSIWLIPFININLMVSWCSEEKTFYYNIPKWLKDFWLLCFETALNQNEQQDIIYT